MLIPFTKMHGLGNDFLVLDRVSHDVQLSPAQIRQLSDRHFGVGFDQLLIIEAPSDPDVDFDYRIFNGDGSEVEHCGNGARCFAQYVSSRGMTTSNPIRVKTQNRILSLKLQEDNQVSVDMGRPELEPALIPLLNAPQALSYTRQIRIDGKSLDVNFGAVSVGNPHATLIVDELEQCEVSKIGTAIGKLADFPEGVNVGFLQIIDSHHARLRVWERGVGETLACGTGACAAMVVGCLQGLLDDNVSLELTGGTLNVNWQQGESSVIMTGPASTVFEGSFETDSFETDNLPIDNIHI